MERGLLLDVVVAEGAPVLELLAGEDEPLLVRGNALLVLDLRLDVVDGVARLHVEGNRLSCPRRCSGWWKPLSVKKQNSATTKR